MRLWPLRKNSRTDPGRTGDIEGKVVLGGKEGLAGGA